MPGKPSYEMVKAMELVKQGMTPYAAAKQLGLDLSTMYRSRLYKDYKKMQKRKPARSARPKRNPRRSKP